jgi:hypothetical protein
MFHEGCEIQAFKETKETWQNYKFHEQTAFTEQYRRMQDLWFSQQWL